mmetsp:Transcript_25754/g.43169  ORF Transcript_25754/g.43169 Transcript_25754/m.43169 type:complete len:223 (-) Transcript_25754:374-1042(-)
MSRSTRCARPAWKSGLEDVPGFPMSMGNGRTGAWHKQGWGKRYLTHTNCPREKARGDAFPAAAEELKGKELYITTGHNIYTLPVRTHDHTHTFTGQPPGPLAQVHRHRTQLLKTVNTGDMEVIYNTNAQYQELQEQLKNMKRTAMAVQAKTMHRRDNEYANVQEDDPTSVHLRRRAQHFYEKQMEAWATSLNAYVGLPKECPHCHHAPVLPIISIGALQRDA